MGSPFAGDPLGRWRFRRVRRPVATGEIVSDLEWSALERLRERWVLSARQAVELTGGGNEGVRERLKRLVRRGWVDRWESGVCPPLYTLGPGGESLFGVATWWPGGVELLRLVAANEFLLRFGVGRCEVRYGVADARFWVEGREYGVFACRLWPGEEESLMDRVGYWDGPFVVVAADRDQAERVARGLVGRHGRRSWRVTWDGEGGRYLPDLSLDERSVGRAAAAGRGA